MLREIQGPHIPEESRETFSKSVAEQGIRQIKDEREKGRDNILTPEKVAELYKEHEPELSEKLRMIYGDKEDPISIEELFMHYGVVDPKEFEGQKYFNFSSQDILNGMKSEYNLGSSAQQILKESGLFPSNPEVGFKGRKFIKPDLFSEESDPRLKEAAEKVGITQELVDKDWPQFRQMLEQASKYIGKGISEIPSRNN